MGDHVDAPFAVGIPRSARAFASTPRGVMPAVRELGDPTAQHDSIDTVRRVDLPP